uniref:B30.2/SPRY domain-containing protein n=1 Tax=Myripristis murdjan TaxID=586833 RepID=A0A667YVX8_9TELE
MGRLWVCDEGRGQAKTERGVLCVFSPSDACDLTLDPNTAYRKLRLSKHNKKVMREIEQKHPDHPDRFDQKPQVLCREGLTGRCYWEVQWSGEVYIAVTYRGITRRGDESVLGYNKQSWSLRCCDDDNSYSARHNPEFTSISVRPGGSHRVAVYLDCSAGTLSFYRPAQWKFGCLAHITKTSQSAQTVLWCFGDVSALLAGLRSAPVS